MAQPTAYTRQYNFQNFQSTAPSTPLPGNQVDIEFNAVKTTLDQTLSNLAQIQRDDGALKNASVGYDQLKSEVEIGVNPPSAWVTLTAYAARDTVTSGTGFYRCLVSHTSGTFATDLAAAKWELIVDFSTDLSLPVIAAALHASTAKTALEDSDEFYALNSADTYATVRTTFLSVANSLWTKLGALIAGGTGKTTPVDADTIPLSDSAATNATKKLTWANLKTTMFSAIGPAIAAATGKTTPVDADTVLLSDSAASDVNKKLTWANLKATLIAAIGPAIAAATGKTTVADGDSVLLSDSAASDVNKKVTFTNLWANYLKAKADALYQPIDTILTTLAALSDGAGVLTNNGSGTLSWGSSASMTLLGTLTTTSGSTHSITDIAAGYRKFYVEVDGVSQSSTRAMTVALSSTNGAAYGTALTVTPTPSAADTFNGWLEIGNVASAVAAAKTVCSYVANSGAVLSSVIVGSCPTNTGAGADAIQFALNGAGSFDAGTIRVYGVK